MSYKDFASNTFWGRLVDNMIFFSAIVITIWLFHPEDVVFDWKGFLFQLGLTLILSILLSILGFGPTKIATKNKKQSPKE